MKKPASKETLEMAARIVIALGVVDMIKNDLEERYGTLKGFEYEDTLLWAMFIEKQISMYPAMKLEGIDKLLKNRDSKLSDRIFDVINFGAEMQKRQVEKK